MYIAKHSMYLPLGIAVYKFFILEGLSLFTFFRLTDYVLVYHGLQAA